MSPEPDGSHYIRVEGHLLVCGEKGHSHGCEVIVAAFRLLLSQMRLKDKKIKELEETLNETILHQEVNGLFRGRKGANEGGDR